MWMLSWFWVNATWVWNIKSVIFMIVICTSMITISYEQCDKHPGRDTCVRIWQLYRPMHGNRRKWLLIHWESTFIQLHSVHFNVKMSYEEKWFSFVIFNKKNRNEGKITACFPSMNYLFVYICISYSITEIYLCHTRSKMKI